MSTDPTRRAMLAGAAALPLAAIAGCKAVGALATPPRPGPDVGLLTAAIAQEQQLIARYETSLGRPRLAGTLRPLLAEHRLHLAQLQGRLIVPSGAATPTPAPPPSAPATGPDGSAPHSSAQGGSGSGDSGPASPGSGDSGPASPGSGDSGPGSPGSGPPGSGSGSASGSGAASPAPSGPAGAGRPARPSAVLAGLRTAEQHASARLLDQLTAAPPALAQLLASISASEATHAAVLAAAGRDI